MSKLGYLFRYAATCGTVAFLLAAGVQARDASPRPASFSERMSARPAALEQQQDTLEFSEGMSRIEPLTAAQAAQASAPNCTTYCGTTVSYTSWKGNTTTMQEFDGLYVRVLVPQSWFDDPTFTESARHTFIDGFDLVYQYLYEIVGRRPGTALDTLAYVNPPGCGSGCGSVGGLGAEYGWGWSADGAAHGLEGYGEIHEMTHNFDSYGGSYKFGDVYVPDPSDSTKTIDLGPLPDSSHYWTTVLRAIYTYSGNQNDGYDHQYEGWLLSSIKAADPWVGCVAAIPVSPPTSPPTKTYLPGCGATGWYAPVGLFFRLSHLYGQSAITRWMAFIKANQASATDQDKLDHFFEAYSAAANHNVNCVFVELHWPISQTVVDWAKANYGDTTDTTQNPDCSNGPNGKSSILDLAPEFAPPATPAANNYSGPGGGFWSPQSVGFPGTANSTGVNGVDSVAGPAQKAFTFQWSAGQNVLVYYCSPSGGHSGGTLIVHYNGNATYWDGPSFTPGTCNTTTFTAPTVGSYGIVVKGGTDTGAYSIVAVPAPPSSLQPQDWGKLSVSRNAATGEFTMTVSQVDASKVQANSTTFPGPQTVRFWAQNYGWVKEIPWVAGSTTYTAKWTPPAALSADIEFRAQVYADAANGYASNQTVPVVYYLIPRTALYTALNPARLLDTRIGAGNTTVDGVAQGTGPIASVGTYRLPVTGRAGIPAGVVAVALNVTPVNPAVYGYFALWSGVGATPNASNLNLNPNLTIPNLVISPVDSNGQVAIFNGSSAAEDVVVDVQGYFPNASSYVPVTPQRFLDTRSGGHTVDNQYQGGGALASGMRLDLGIAGRTSSVPASGVDAVIVNLTAVLPTAGGFVTAWPSGQTLPNASNLNLNAGLTMPNLVISGLGSGDMSLFNGSTHATDLIADVQGWFPSNSGYTALTPARLLDTRSGQKTIDGQYAGIGALARAASVDLQVGGRGGVPSIDGVGAVVLNVTAVQPAAGGYVTVWPTGSPRPLASNLNLNPGTTIPNLVIAKVGYDGMVSIFNGAATPTDILVDVQGWLPVAP